MRALSLNWLKFTLWYNFHCIRRIFFQHALPKLLMLQEFNLQIELPHLLNTKLSNSYCNKLYETFSISGVLTSHTLMRSKNSLILIFTYLILVLQRVEVFIQEKSEEKYFFFSEFHGFLKFLQSSFCTISLWSPVYVMKIIFWLQL